jgi:predicted DNA-binding transcriptional regulator AlpA
MARRGKNEVLGLIGVAEVSKRLGITPGTFRVWRATGKFPKPTKGIHPKASPMWREEDVLKWIDDIKNAK